MLAIEFPGSHELIDALDQALEQPTMPDITNAVRHALCRLMQQGSVKLPPCVFEFNDEHYSRRELYRSEKHGYSVTAMTWAPGQGTPIHDHHGMWCVEGVWHGALEITQYELLEQTSDRFHFNSVSSIQAGTGSAGSLIPPHEYHAIRNPSSQLPAVSLHVYSAPMTCCSVFNPLEAAWYQRCERKLSLDHVH
ncbi:MAG TPA: cysteine dioxygenase family protein [Rhodanobacteraceae bacterium]|nr:cysteine dioxygenase family protein [Rhodanobacteraceae bacterium]